MLPGNTADATVLLPVVDRLRERFHISRVCVVADRGMISAATIAALEERKLEYILGARERSSAVIRRFVLDDEQPLTPLLVERDRGETQLFVKEVKVGTARCILCRNAAEAERDRSERQAIIEGLSKQLARGDKTLIGNSAYRRYLRRTPTETGKPGPAFEIDPGKLADEARYDGLFVLRTNAKITALQAVLRYRDLLQVEDLFRRAKAILRTRPIYHSCDAAIRGHFCRKGAARPEFQRYLSLLHNSGNFRYSVAVPCKSAFSRSWIVPTIFGHGRSTCHLRPLSSNARSSYFGLTAGLPPGVPGGGIIGIVEPVAGGVCLISGSTPAGGVITPPDRFRAELEVPLAGGTADVAG
jgi:Transposase DDE domain